MKAEPTSLWSISAGERIPAAPLDRDVTVDLAIVGAGFTGCSAALEAARRGASVAVFEASRVAFGGSGRNVGLVNAGLWLPPDQIISQMGEADGTRLIDRLGQAPRLVFDLIERESIACEATRSGTLHLAHSASGLADLRDRFAQGNRIGAPLRLLDAQDTARRVGSGAFHGALLDPRAGTVQPLAYCAGLARAAQGAGARLHEGSAVSDIARQGDGWHLTVNGRTVRAHAVLVATNAYQSGLARPRTSFSTVNYSQFATAPLPDDLRARILPGGEGCWDTGLVMTSIRTDRAGRLILGGMGDVAGPGGRAHAAWARRKLRVLFPDLHGIAFEYQWSGRIAMTSDHVPKVLRFGPRGLAIFGYSGRGIAPGTAFGTAAAAALLDDRPEAMPLPVVSGHAERFTTLRSAVFEAGATLIHALPPSRFQGRS